MPELSVTHVLLVCRLGEHVWKFWGRFQVSGDLVLHKLLFELGEKESVAIDTASRIVMAKYLFSFLPFLRT